ncbi:hypothetical protein ANO14919_003050 [Xylariales sp. No.14919]|nr:hypothetical protein ANO14919_003050 [Xylariales sp. No.14919]
MSSRRRDSRSRSPQERIFRARVRDYPPGPSHEMDNEDIEAMAGPSRSPNLAQTISGRSDQAQPTKATPKESSSITSESSGDETDVDDDSEEEEQTDDPPLRPGRNLTTMGFEFELLIAICRSSESMPDPHPRDGRWLSETEAIIKKDEDSRSWKYTCRNKIIDFLVAQGVSAHKTEERSWIDVEDSTDTDFQWWDSLEYQNPNQNDQLSNWKGNWLWNSDESEDVNVAQGVNELCTQFLQYHHDNNLAPYMTRQAVIMSVRDSVVSMIQGDSTSIGRLRIMTIWYEKMSDIIRNEKMMHYSAEGDPDPNLIPGLSVGARYTKWSCTDDISIKSLMPKYTDYVIPEGSIPTEPDTQRPVGYPPDLYRWFGAELVSSVLDYDNPQTQLTLRTACAAIRDAMRVHKPMAIIGSGVHIHIGQQAGWTLLHLKKLVTLWHLMEPSIFRLHRRDREQSEWCTPMTDCDLARLVFSRENRYSAVGANMMGPNKALYENYMNEYIPDFRAHQALFEFLSHIWMYGSIDSLVRGLRADASCISWRVGGNKLSDPPGLRLQTLEFRVMQGTLDAEHIWKWAGVLERLVIFARDSTAEVFRNALAAVMTGTIPDEVGLNKDDLAWFASRQTDDGYFAYPEGGAINWSDPFMVRGYGDTHNPPNA